MTDSYRTALFIAAGVAALAGPVMLIGLRGAIRPHRTARRFHCAVEGPPLQPDPRHCSVHEAAA